MHNKVLMAQDKFINNLQRFAIDGGYLKESQIESLFDSLKINQQST